MKFPILNFTRAASFAGIVALSCSLAKGEESAPSAWDVSSQAGIGLTDGNSDTLNLHAGLRANRITSDDELFLGTDFFYSEDNGTTTSDSIYSFGQYNRLISDRAYFGVLADFLYDEILAVDYRVTVGPTLGYYLIKNERTSLAVEAGAAYLWEEVGGVADDYVTARFAERLSHNLTDTLSVFQSVVFSPAIDDWGNYILTADAGIETRMSDRTSLRIFARDRYDSRPAAGLEKNDFGVYTEISLALGSSPAPLPAVGGKGTIAASGGSPWDMDLGVAGSYTNGNSDTLSVAADLSAVRITDDNETFLGAGGGYGESNTVRNQERVYAFGQYNEMLSDRFYLGARTDFLYDDISAVDYRVTPSALLGYYVIKNDATSLALEVGPSFTWEKQAGLTNEYFGVFFGERFSHKVNDRVELWQSAKLVLDINNTGNFIVDAQAGLDVKIGGSLSLRTAVRDLYDGEPAAGLEKNDFMLSSGLVWSF